MPAESRYDDQQFELWCEIEEAEDIARRLWKVVTDAKEGKFHAEEGRLAPPPDLAHSADPRSRMGSALFAGGVWYGLDTSWYPGIHGEENRRVHGLPHQV